MRGTILVLAAALLLSACRGGGGGDGSGDDGGGDPKSAVTKAGFIAKADSICAKANTDREALMEPGLYDRPYKFKRIIRYTEKLAALYDEALANLSALEVPKGAEVPIGSMRQLFGLAFEQSEPWISANQVKDGLRGEDAYFAWVEMAGKAQGIASEYGLSECAGFGMP